MCNCAHLVFFSPHPRTSKTDREVSVLVTRRRVNVKTEVEECNPGFKEVGNPGFKANIKREVGVCKPDFPTYHSSTILACPSCASAKMQISGFVYNEHVKNVSNINGVGSATADKIHQLESCPI